MRPIVVQGHMCDCKCEVVGSIPTRGNDMLRCRDESAALSSAIQHAMPQEFVGKWGTKCLNTRFPLPTLLSLNIFSSVEFCVYGVHSFHRLA